MTATTSSFKLCKEFAAAVETPFRVIDPSVVWMGSPREI